MTDRVASFGGVQIGQVLQNRADAKYTFSLQKRSLNLLLESGQRNSIFALLELPLPLDGTDTHSGLFT